MTLENWVKVLEGAIPFFSEVSSNMAITAIKYSKLGSREYQEYVNLNLILQYHLELLNQAEWYINSTDELPPWDVKKTIEQSNEISEATLGITYQWDYV